MIPEFVFIASGLIVLLAALFAIRQNAASYATDLRAQIASLRAHLKQREEILRDNGRNQSRHLFLKESCQQLSQKESRLADDIAVLEPRANEIAAKVKNLTEEKASLESNLRLLEEDKRKWEDRIRELDRIDEIVGERNERLEELSQKIKESEAKILEYADQLKLAEEASTRLASLKSDILVLSSHKEELTLENKTLTGENTQLEDRIKKLTKEIEELESRKKIAEELHTIAKGMLKIDDDDDADRLEDLWSPVVPGKWKTGGEMDEQGRVGHVIGTLKNQKLDFPDRVVHAFHTALKVSDISPLVVLAGISGTGKSLLPRVYSAAMGIHFMGMPVQPRWDSPQDMFGFYNYMERKYKATELSRAMVQFERFPQENIRKSRKSDLSDQVLMVLLDEMNLARVEYYFSEFLSKLETRRDIDIQDAIERSKAEISIEAGHGNDLRLFPGSNLLFVGTMNEDESTQSLSDKVLDRSCVLRFGKPSKTLNTKPTTFTEKHDKALNYDTWRKWTDKSPSTCSDYVTNTILKLNEVMAKVGRPFGHRVGQAINSYVTNYPNWVRGSEKKALADQVEQRILPKLRGLDVQEYRAAFDQLKEIVDDFDDPQLRQGLASGCESSSSLGMKSFIWNGLDRNDDTIRSQ